MIDVPGGTIRIKGSTVFQNNSAGSFGGAIFVSSNSSSFNISENVTFSENQAPYGGAVSASCNVLIAGIARFVMNKADYMGGAIYLDPGQTLSLAESASFSLNKAGSGGGGVFLSEGCSFFYDRQSRIYCKYC